MIDKDIGFNRNVKLDWLNAMASYVSETYNLLEIRERLDTIMLDVEGVETKRKNIDILFNIWLKSREIAPDLYTEAKELFRNTDNPNDRLWLHYGLTLVYYSYFREVAILVGQISRFEDEFTKLMVKEKLIASRGELGSLERSLRYVLSSMKDWGVLSEGKNQSYYVANRKEFETSNEQFEAWLLACALKSHPASQLPFEDLLRLPELFPFMFNISVDTLRKHQCFNIYRQGAGLMMVELETNKYISNSGT